MIFQKEEKGGRTMTERYKICKGKPMKIANLDIVANELTGKRYWTLECVVEPYKRMADEVKEEDEDYE